ncbi:MAG: tRNA preQ1(34) S-adenosylmethionine ribosyltransferase-isomerase QueA [Deltaproteobacteria bacterium RBG_16_49_23]|nr:MAG: tRNA preQ1(34) S-adenosylmethionine ribosyltransferase-isomerase QueA [Deltaproteobacteria bacterium RBG_16_49_23]
MRIEEFDYTLPRSLIAQHPSPCRGESRLMVLGRSQGVIEHRNFGDIPDYLNSGDLLVMNNTRVLPARLIGHKETGGRVEILLVPSWNGAKGEWEALVRNAGKVKGGVRIQFGQDVYGELSGVKGGRAKITFTGGRPVEDLLREAGHIPLPPYIKREDEPLDRERYQTVIAEKDGSIAAPTAGLHFTQSMIRTLREKGVKITFITLHIGPGTFTPVKAEEVEEHRMDQEWVEITEEASEEIEETRMRGKRVIAVGTTTTRALESFSDREGRIKPGRAHVSLFIHPPYYFRAVDGLVTNFHLPKSTLIMLVSAFAGRDLILSAYQDAVKRKYHFYSYGDAMLIL